MDVELALAVARPPNEEPMSTSNGPNSSMASSNTRLTGLVPPVLPHVKRGDVPPWARIHAALLLSVLDHKP